MTNNLTYNPQLPHPELAAPKNYYHVSFCYSGLADGDVINPVLDGIASDWLRYAPHSWIIYTAYNQAQIFNALKPQLKSGDQLLVLQLMHGQPAQGWLPRWIWDWINTPRI